MRGWGAWGGSDPIDFSRISFLLIIETIGSLIESSYLRSRWEQNNFGGNYSGECRIIQATLSSFPRLDLRVSGIDPGFSKHNGVSSPVYRVI